MHWGLGVLAAIVVVALLAMLFARAVNVFPLAQLVNCRRRTERHISFGFQTIMWFAGLRGAIAFALCERSWRSLSTPPYCVTVRPAS
jgi:NhaP-type Na+/H+ or K+/H+ antiporter